VESPWVELTGVGVVYEWRLLCGVLPAVNFSTVSVGREFVVVSVAVLLPVSFISVLCAVLLYSK